MKEAYIINQKLDIVDVISEYTKLHKPKGSQYYRGSCPIHGGNNDSSMMVNEYKKDFHCFACGASGNAINFIMEMQKVDYFEAVKYLADLYDIQLGEDYQEEYNRFIAKEKELKKYTSQVNKVEDYLKKERGFTDETIGKMQYGFDGKDLIIPIFDSYGRLISFTKRTLGTGVKYINEKNNDIYEKGKTLYNLHNAKPLMKNGSIYVVEGYLDASSGNQMGLATVAYCGSELTKDQIQEINSMAIYNDNYVVYLAPDNDETGKKKIPRMRDKIKQWAPKLTVHIVDMPIDIKDFNDALLKGMNAKDFPTIGIDLYCLMEQLKEMKTIEQQYLYVEDYISTVTNPMIRSDIAKVLSDVWEKPLVDINEWLKGTSNSDELLNEFKGIDEAVSELRELYSSGITNLGFPKIDASFDHIRKGDVVLVAGKPASGKTYFAVQTALHNAINEKQNTLFFSMEMTNAELYERFIAYILKCTTEEAKRLILNSDERVFKIKEILDSRLLVNDKSTLNIDEIKDRIRIANQRKFDEPCGIIIIDYIQKLKGAKDYATFADQVERLKEVAKEFNLVVVALVQLNREVRDYEEPTLESLRGAGELEQVGTHILGLYIPEKDPSITAEQAYRLQNIVAVSILKARRGYKVKNFSLLKDLSTFRLLEVENIDV